MTDVELLEKLLIEGRALLLEGERALASGRLSLVEEFEMVGNVAAQKARVEWVERKVATLRGEVIRTH